MYGRCPFAPLCGAHKLVRCFRGYIYILGVSIRSVCLACISMTFELTGNTCITVSRRGTCFGTASHVQQSLKRMAKCTLKEFQEVSEVLNTMRIWSFLETTILCFTSHTALSQTHQSHHRLHGVVAAVFASSLLVSSLV